MLRPYRLRRVQRCTMQNITRFFLQLNYTAEKSHQEEKPGRAIRLT